MSVQQNSQKIGKRTWQAVFPGWRASHLALEKEGMVRMCQSFNGPEPGGPESTMRK